MSVSTMKKIFKWPLSMMIVFILWFEIGMYFTVRLMMHLIENFSGFWRDDKSLREKLQRTSSYDEFKSIAQEMDLMEPRKSWIEKKEFPCYNLQNIESFMEKIDFYKKSEKDVKLMNLLQIFLQKNVKEYEIGELHSKTYYNTKNIVKDLHLKVMEMIDYIIKSSKIPEGDKKLFLHKAIESNGETAFCFSGGAKLAYFHFGVFSELLEQGLLSKIVSGTSGGALIAAYYATRKTEELKNWGEFFNETCYKLWNLNLKRLIDSGHILDWESIKTQLKKICFGDMTFLEAFEKTNKVLNIVVTESVHPHKSVMLNHRTAPNICIWSALGASMALPKIMPPGELFIKTSENLIKPYHKLGNNWIDGSCSSDVPLKMLREKFNVTFTVVSQANPHVTPFVSENEGSSGRPPIHRSGDGLKGGFILSGVEIYLRTDMQKWIIVLQRLGIGLKICGFDFSKLISQKFSGTVTIYAKPNLCDYLKLLKSATREEIDSLVERGKQACWPKIRMISYRSSVEQKLKDALRNFIQKRN